MNHLRAILCILLCAGAVVVRAATTQSTAPTDVLKSKGLTHFGNMYLLDGDAHLSELLRPMRMAKHDMEAAEKTRSDIQDEIRGDEDQLYQWVLERDDVGAREAKASKKTAEKNELIEEWNALNDKIGRGQVEIERRQEDLQKARVPQKEYFEALAKFLASFQVAADGYQNLTTDAEVASAIKSLNASSKITYRLGPSPAFQAELPEFRKLQSESKAGVIKLKIQANVAMVNVTINGAVDVDMVVDSGASDVSLSPAVAERLGIKLSKSDRIARTTIANGQSVETHLITVKSIQLGPFIVENVLCGVQPSAARDSDCLLGGTFLQNFAYQMDLTNAELHLSQISGRPADDKPVASSASPSSAPNPSGSSASSPSPAATPPAPSPSIVIGKPKQTVVKAATGWSVTDIQVEEEKCYQIMVSGRWTNAKGQDCGGEGICPAQWSSPLGPIRMSANQLAQYYVDQCPRSALIARVDRDKPGFFVGTGAKFLAPISGTLEFAMNDGNDESAVRSGQLSVSVVEIKPQWLTDGSVVIRARVDGNDFLHITSAGVYWEWGGHAARVGEHAGHFPTIVNGIFWWPTWTTRTTTTPQSMPGLDPTAKIRLIRVIGNGSDVEITASSSKDTTLHFSKGRGNGPRDVGCEVQFTKQ